MNKLPRHVLTILAVKDLKRSVDFYTKVFDWPMNVDVPVYVEFTLPDGRGLGLYDRKSFALNTGGHVPEAVPEGAITGTEIYLHCNNLEQIMQRLETINARLLSSLSVRGWGDEAAYYADPDGNVLVIARPM